VKRWTHETAVTLQGGLPMPNDWMVYERSPTFEEKDTAGADAFLKQVDAAEAKYPRRLVHHRMRVREVC